MTALSKPKLQLLPVLPYLSPSGRDMAAVSRQHGDKENPSAATQGYGPCLRTRRHSPHFAQSHSKVIPRSKGGIQFDKDTRLWCGANGGQP
jgi:hypothetical protein